MVNLKFFENFPEYCVPFNVHIAGGNDPGCRHFFPIGSKIEHADWVEWKCAHCGATAKAEVYD